MKVLIVDDSAVMRKVVERALRQAGMELSEVIDAANGLEALAALSHASAARAPFALILTDIHMPVMDGLAFLEEKRKQCLAEDVPVVMIATEGSELQVLRAIAAGARGYICKPFTAEQVKARIVPLVRSASSYARSLSSLGAAHAKIC